MMRFISFITLLLVLLTAPVFQTAAESVTSSEYTVLKNAYEQLQEGRFEKCLNTVSPLLDKRHPLSQALYYAAMACGSLNRYPEAIEFLKQGTRLYPEKKNFRHSLGAYQIQAADFKGAVETYRHLINMDKTVIHPSYYYHLSFAFYSLEKYKKALDTIFKITSGDSFKRHHLLLQAHCQIALEKWQDCETTARRLISLDPTKPQNWRLLGRVAVNLKKYDRACAALEIKDILKTTPETRHTIKRLYRVQSAWNETARVQEKENSYAYAQNLALGGQYEKALRVLDQAPLQHMEKSYLRGRLLFALDRNTEAVDALLEAQNQEHNFSMLDEKRKQKLTLKEKRRQKDGLKADALLLAGQIYWMDHNWVKARDIFKKLELLPGRKNLGKSLAACMQYYLDETGEKPVLPELYDPPLVMMPPGDI